MPAETRIPGREDAAFIGAVPDGPGPDADELVRVDYDPDFPESGPQVVMDSIERMVYLDADQAEQLAGFLQEGARRARAVAEGR